MGWGGPGEESWCGASCQVSSEVAENISGGSANRKVTMDLGRSQQEGREDKVELWKHETETQA